MAAKNLSNCLEPNSRGPPADVVFKFTDESGVVKKVEAHKLILAIASDVFDREFYGSMKAEDEIDIVDASQEVFQSMIDTIYNKQPNLKRHDIRFLCSLYNLAEKYNLDDLRSEIIVTIQAYEFTKESVINVGLIAEECKHHLPLHEALFNAAAGFLFKELNGSLDEAIGLFKENKEGDENKSLVMFKLLVFMHDIKKSSLTCKNCKQYVCLNGKGITISNFATGAKVTHELGQAGIESIISFQRSDGDGHWFIGKFKDGSQRKNCALDPKYYVYNCV